MQNNTDCKKLDTAKAKKYIDEIFEGSVVQSLCQFISIPNTSRSFDQDWYTNGLLQKAAEHIKKWVQGLNIKGFKTQIIKHQGYSPIIFTQVQGDIPDKTVLFYGHFDKQPEMTGWDADKGPTKPVIIDGKLYGRGGADDGYSTYSSMLALKAIQQQGLPIPRCVMITQGDQESGNHIDHYIQALKERIGNPHLIFCLDSGTMDYQSLWLTNSLRGYVSGVLTIQTLKEGVHSGDSSGIVPSCFRIFNMLINRLENPQTGKINDKFRINIPPDRYSEAYHVYNTLGKDAVRFFPFFGDTKPVSSNYLELMLNRTWEPQLTIVGLSNLPPVESAGNTMIPQMKFKISFRLPPTLNPEKAAQDLEKLLTENPPFGAKVTFTNVNFGSGWNAPSYKPNLQNSIEKAALQCFNSPKSAYGEGGSIPLMGLLSSTWPEAQFLITGVLGPESNAHGPNEFIHLEYTKKLTYFMAQVVSQSSN